MRKDGFLGKPGLLALLPILIGCAFHWSEQAARFIAAGIVVSFIAFGAQQSTLRCGLLDHNDIFHLIQMPAMYLLYRGGALLVTSGNRDSL